MYSTVRRALGPVFMFCAPGLILSGSEGVGSCFHVLRSRDPFSCFALIRHVFGGSEGVASRLHVLCSQTHFRRYRGRPLPFSCFPLHDTFSAVRRASGTVFMFCAPVLIFDGTDGVGHRFHALRSWTRFRGAEGVGSRFHILLSRTHFQRFRGRRVPVVGFWNAQIPLMLKLRKDLRTKFLLLLKFRIKVCRIITERYRHLILYNRR
jgi:hypothetical protein